LALLHDPDGKAGLAHALEHCVLMQTEHLPNNDLQIELKKIGGDVNAFTNQSTTFFPLKARAENDNFTTLADILRQIVTEPCFDDTRIQNELKVIDNEYHDELDNRDREVLIESDRKQHRETIFSGRVLGNPENFLTLSSSDFLNFMRQHYKAQTMCLYVVAPYQLADTHVILEGTLGQITEGGRSFTTPESIYGQTMDVRLEETEKNQNNFKLFFTSPSSTDIKQLSIATLAQNTISQTLVWHLRHNAGCTYSSQFSNFALTSTQKIVSLDIKTRPHQTNDFLEALLDYTTNIDSIPDVEIESGINNLKHQNFSFRKAAEVECGGIVFYDQTLKQLMDMDKERDILDTITLDDVREKMKEMLSSLTGIYATGPQPNLLPPLETLQTKLKQASGLNNVEGKPTPQTNVLYQPRI
jgi:predicted Zn-dependent peptidase